MALTIAQAVVKIIRREPFYGLFLLGLNKYFDPKIPTACVRKNGINVELVINEDYWTGLEDKYKIALLLHECGHILYGHLFMLKDFADSKRFNDASDLQVNSYLWDVHPDWLHPSQFNLEEGRGTKYYYEHLPEGIENKIFPQDEHEWKDFESLTEAEKKLVKNQIDYQVKSVAEEIKKSHGNIPGQFKDYIEGLFIQRERVFNWKSYFRRVVGNSIKSHIKSTRSRPSLFFKGQPGIVLKFNPKILVAIDTSGSISDEELNEFFSELQHLYKSGVYIEVVEFDTTIQNKFVYKGQKKDIEIVGRGGTDMTDVYNYYTENRDFSTLVMFTDGYLDIDYPRHRNVVWVISSNGKIQNYPGVTVYIPRKI